MSVPTEVPGDFSASIGKLIGKIVSCINSTRLATEYTEVKAILQICLKNLRPIKLKTNVLPVFLICRMHVLVLRAGCHRVHVVRSHVEWTEGSDRLHAPIAKQMNQDG